MTSLTLSGESRSDVYVLWQLSVVLGDAEVLTAHRALARYRDIYMTN
nr:hypothetical protein [Kibdelosporangium sp. MJ126-NF4]